MQSLQDHFLIAMPAMADPNFNETVTYVCKHDADGAFGIVINSADRHVARRNARPAGHRDRRRSLAERPVMHGGPVEPERGFVLHRSEHAFEATLAAGAEIKVTSSPDILAAIARGDGPDPAVIALGYAGWGRGQLEVGARQQHVAHRARESGHHLRDAVRAALDRRGRPAGRRHPSHHEVCRSCLAPKDGRVARLSEPAATATSCSHSTSGFVVSASPPPTSRRAPRRR